LTKPPDLPAAGGKFPGRKSLNFKGLENFAAIGGIIFWSIAQKRADSVRVKSATHKHDGPGKNAPAKKYVRSSYLAAKLDVHRRTVEGWAIQGLVPSIKIGGTIRFDEDEFMAAITRRK